MLPAAMLSAAMISMKSKMISSHAFLAAVALSSTQVFAAGSSFEGAIKMRITIEKTSRPKAVLKAELLAGNQGTLVRIGAENGRSSHTTLLLKSDPGYLYLVNESRKQFHRMVLAAHATVPKEFRVKRKGA